MAGNQRADHPRQDDDTDEQRQPGWPRSRRPTVFAGAGHAEVEKLDSAPRCVVVTRHPPIMALFLSSGDNPRFPERVTASASRFTAMSHARRRCTGCQVTETLSGCEGIPFVTTLSDAVPVGAPLGTLKVTVDACLGLTDIELIADVAA